MKEGFKAVKHDELNAFIYDARVFLLYSTHEEAKHILQEVRSVF